MIGACKFDVRLTPAGIKASDALPRTTMLPLELFCFLDATIADEGTSDLRFKPTPLPVVIE